MLAALWQREFSTAAKISARVPAAARLDVPRAGEMPGEGWPCSPELVWRADKLLESIQSDGG